MTLTLYFGGFAVAQLVAGPLSDALGRRPITFAFMGIYCLASLAALVAPLGRGADGGALPAGRRRLGGVRDLAGDGARPVPGRAVVADHEPDRHHPRRRPGVRADDRRADADGVRLAVALRRSWRCWGSSWRWSTALGHAARPWCRTGRGSARARSPQPMPSCSAAATSLSAAGVIGRLDRGALRAGDVPALHPDRPGRAVARRVRARHAAASRAASSSGSLATRALLDRVGRGPAGRARPRLHRGGQPRRSRSCSVCGAELPAGDAAGRRSTPSASPSSCRRCRPPPSRPFPRIAGAAAALMGFLQMGCGPARSARSAALIGDPVRGDGG